MSAPADSATIIAFGTQRDVSHDDYSLKNLQRYRKDKLGNTVLEILWLSPDYAIYRSKVGVFIHFSDDKEKEKQQRAAFTTICAELCELRFLTNEINATRLRLPGFLKRFLFFRQYEEKGHSLFDHNIAQSLMLLMEGNLEEAKEIATAALDMAVARTTNDNTIRYLRAAFRSAILLSALLGLVYVALSYVVPNGLEDRGSNCFIACFYGILGAGFSIMTRVQAFEMKPCQQSNMNYWMALSRVMIGLIGGLAFYLLAISDLGQSLINAKILDSWHSTALIGFLGGFAERMVQTVFRRTASGLEGKTGTPVQRAREPHKPTLLVMPGPDGSMPMSPAT